MSEINLRDWLPPGSESVAIKGMLLRQYDLAEDLDLLDQDILELELPDGLKIDVGWFPENDPTGRFVIRVYRDAITRLLRDPIEEIDPVRVAESVGDLVKQFGSPRAKAV
jgi:hypothetical protein